MLGIYSLISVLVLILYLPILLLNPLHAIFSNAWVSSPADFYDKFLTYLISLNDFWWGNRLGILLSLLCLAGLIWMSLKQNFRLLFPFIISFLFLPFLMIFLQKVLPFQRVWLYYFPILSLGLSYMTIMLIHIFFVSDFLKRTVGYGSVFCALVLCIWFNYDLLETKTFAYYKEKDVFLARIDSLHIRNIEVRDPEYNTLIRLYSLEKKNQLNVISGQEKIIHPDLLVTSKDQEIPDSAYTLLFGNSYVKAYKPRQ
jgi:hypothetical protein